MQRLVTGTSYDAAYATGVRQQVEAFHGTRETDDPQHFLDLCEGSGIPRPPLLTQLPHASVMQRMSIPNGHQAI
jgi:hypothetical protein